MLVHCPGGTSDNSPGLLSWDEKVTINRYNPGGTTEAAEMAGLSAVPSGTQEQGGDASLSSHR
jgi:hypothetical protein